jgi:hypothetical protein
MNQNLDNTELDRAVGSKAILKWSEIALIESTLLENLDTEFNAGYYTAFTEIWELINPTRREIIFTRTERDIAESIQSWLDNREDQDEDESEGPDTSAQGDDHSVPDFDPDVLKNIRSDVEQMFRERSATGAESEVA